MNELFVPPAEEVERARAEEILRRVAAI
jgi:hypothetical protein